MIVKFFEWLRDRLRWVFGSDSRIIGSSCLIIFTGGCIIACWAEGLSGLWVGVAAFASGGIVGFLFGIPRVIQSGRGESQYEQRDNRVNARSESRSLIQVEQIAGLNTIIYHGPCNSRNQRQGWRSVSWRHKKTTWISK